MKTVITFLFALGLSMDLPATSGGCIAKEFVQDYCYFGLPEELSSSAIKVEPIDYGYKASAVIAVQSKETVLMVLACNDGFKTISESTRAKEEKHLLLVNKRYTPEDAKVDLHQHYKATRTQLTRYICKESL